MFKALRSPHVYHIPDYRDDTSILQVAGRDPDKEMNAHCLPKPARHPGGYETV